MIAANCPLLSKCAFFNDVLEDMPSTSVYMKNLYCRNEYQTCARYRVFMEAGKHKPPRDLFPHDADQAEKIITLYMRHN
jgi:hypothetical protein